MTATAGGAGRLVGTNDDRRRPPDRRGVRRRPCRRPDRARSRTSSRAIRTRRRACGSPSPRSTPGPTSSRSGCRTPTRSPTARRSSAPRRSRSRAGATLDGSLRLIERIAAARPATPIVPMGYANQFLGGGDGAAAARRLAEAGAAGVIVADLTPDEGAPFEAVARERRPRGRLPRRSDDAARAPRRDRRPERRLPLLRLARRRHRRAGVAADDRRAARPRRHGRVAGARSAVGFGVSRPAHVRAIAEGRRRPA